MDYLDVEFEMPGFPPLLWQRLQKTLPLCGVFNSDSALRGVFWDARLNLWRAGLPEEANPAARVTGVISYLYGRSNKVGENGLFLLLQVLRDSINPEDDLYSKLESLAMELEQLQAAARLAAQQKAAAQRARDLAKLAANNPDQRAAALAAAHDWVDIAPDDQAARALLADLIAQEEEARRKKQEAEEEARRKTQEAEEAARKEEVRRKKQEVEDAARKTWEEEARRKKQAAEAAARKAREEQERQAEARCQVQLDGLYTRIKAADDEQDWPEVLQLAGQIQAVQPGDATAAQWGAHAREQLRRPPVVPQPAPVAAPKAAVARLPFEPELILIPAGEFLMGSNPQKDKDAQESEQPQHTLYLPDYYIAKTSTTNAQYAAFVKATGYKVPSHWKDGKLPKGKEDHPVVNVSWEDTLAYCKWLAETTGKPYTLPSEAEWEKAARGTDGRIYPWGNERLDKTRCNFGLDMGFIKALAGNIGTIPVGKYSPRGDSPYGCVDMAGNVFDWTRSLRDSYPYRADDGRENLQAAGARVVRGGSWFINANLLRTANRGRDTPSYTGSLLGFRCSVARVQD